MRLCGCPRHGHRDPKDGVGTELCFIFRTVHGQHHRVNVGLQRGILAGQGRCDHLVDVPDGLDDAFSEISFLVPITQFQRLVLARRCPGRHNGTPAKSGFEHAVHFHGRIPAGIQNLSRPDALD